MCRGRFQRYDAITFHKGESTNGTPTMGAELAATAVAAGRLGGLTAKAAVAAGPSLAAETPPPRDEASIATTCGNQTLRILATSTGARPTKARSSRLTEGQIWKHLASATWQKR